MTHETLRRSAGNAGRPASSSIRDGVSPQHRDSSGAVVCLRGPFAAVCVARSHDGTPPPEFNAVCYQLVQEAGPDRLGTLGERFHGGKNRSAKFRDDTPGMGGRPGAGWIADAYQWRASDEQIRQWAASWFSRRPAKRGGLSVHEAIAVGCVASRANAVSGCTPAHQGI